MKNFLVTMVRWLSTPRARGDGVRAGQAPAVPEHERRMRELEQSGRKLFLP